MRCEAKPGKYLAEHFIQRVPKDFEREPAIDAGQGFSTQALAERRVLDQGMQPLGSTRCVSRGNQVSVHPVTYHFWNTADPGADHGNTPAHGLERHHGKALAYERWNHQHVHL